MLEPPLAPFPAPFGAAVSRLRLSWTVEVPVAWRQSPGDTLWSALGAAMHGVDALTYQALFKPGVGDGGRPSPFVLSVHAACQQVTADVTLVGSAVASGPLWEAAASRVGRIGSTPVVPSSVRAALMGTDGCWRPIGGPAPDLTQAVPASAPVAPARIRFETPVHLRSQGAAAPPTLDLLLRRLGWRVRELVRLYGDGPVPDFRPLLDHAARSVSSCAAPAAWIPGHRYSRRRERAEGLPHIPTGGFTGAIALTGDVAPIVPLLALGAWLHVGKNAERGYGRYTFS